MYRLSILIASTLLSLHVSAGLQGCGGTYQKDFIPNEHAAEDWSDNMNDLCSTARTGPSSFTQNGWALSMQQQLQPGDVNVHCFDAMNDIFNDCIMNGYATGTWTTDPTNKEWYWGWMNPQDMEYDCIKGGDCF